MQLLLSFRNYYGETCVDVIESAGVSSEAKERIKELISSELFFNCYQ